MVYAVVLLRFLLLAVFLLVLGRALWSWIDPGFRRPAGRFLYQTTEPLLAPVRRVLPRTGMLDLSPFVLIILLSILLRLFLV